MTKAIITCKSGRKYIVDNYWNFEHYKDGLFVEIRKRDLNDPFSSAETVLYMASNSIESIDLIETGDEHDNG